jgi:isoprenylcysteine carboxyl methyltransferase (ICMT) family protein YpbQ
MNKTIIIVMATFFLIRLMTLIFSIKNETRLKNEGAIEYGKTNSTLMALLHIFYYLGSFFEAHIRQVQFDGITVIGIYLYSFSIIILFYIIHELRAIWTVKLLIAKGHRLNNGFIFKYFRHPNYFLVVIPELIAVSLICKSWILSLSIFPLYLISLGLRIRQEEKVMRQTFANY